MANTPPPTPPGAEVLVADIDDDAIDSSGKVQIQIDQMSSETSGVQDITINDLGTEPITEIEVKKLGDGDGSDDIVRLDLRDFDDNFLLEFHNEDAGDKFILVGAESTVDNGDGTYTVTYTGSDGLGHTVTVNPGSGGLETYAGEDGVVDGEDTGEVMDIGYSDYAGDQIDGTGANTIEGNGGGDTITGGAGNDTIYGDYNLAEGTTVEDYEAAASSAEQLTYQIDDSRINDSDGKVTINVESHFGTNVSGQEDVTILDGGTEDIDQIFLEKMGKDDDEEDAFRFDLSGFDDDFTVNIKSEGTEDRLIFTNVTADTENPDGSHTITYTGSDGLAHTVTVNPGDAQVITHTGDGQTDYDDTIDAGDGDDTVDGGFGDDTIDGGTGNDTLKGNVGSDTITGGAGDDIIYGDFGAELTAETAPAPASDAEQLTYQINNFNVDLLGNVHVNVAYDFWTDVSGKEDVTIVDGGFRDIDNIFLSKMGKDDDEEDTFRFDLSGFDDDFSVYIKSEGTEDRLVFTNVTSDTENGDGSHTITYTGSDGAEHTVTVHPGDAQVLTYDAEPDLTPYADDGDVIDGGDGADTIDAGFGNDSVTGGAGDDTIVASTGSDTIDAGTGTDTYTAEGGTTYAGGPITVTVDDTGTGTVEKSDGSTDTISNFEKFVAGETDGVTDSLTLTDAVRAFDVDTELQGIDDTATGTFTPSGGGGPICFGGPGEPTLSQLLSGSYDPGTGPIAPVGAYQIDGGDETGQIGDVGFENFEEVNFSVICFARGTRIETDRGEIAVEDLAAGDLVRTLDNGLQPIRWIGSTTVPARGALAPIEIRAGALGNRETLRVSPQHRMLMQGWRVELLFGEAETLVPAKHLLNDSTIRRIEGGEVEYFHVLFDRHEIVFAEGIPSESFHPGAVGLGGMAEPTREEILALFPHLRHDAEAFGTSARRSLRGFEAAALA